MSTAPSMRSVAYYVQGILHVTRVMMHSASLVLAVPLPDEIFHKPAARGATGRGFVRHCMGVRIGATALSINSGQMLTLTGDRMKPVDGLLSMTESTTQRLVPCARGFPSANPGERLFQQTFHPPLT